MSIYSFNKYIVYYILYKISYKKISKNLYKPIDICFECVIIVLTTKEREVYKMSEGLKRYTLLNLITDPKTDGFTYTAAVHALKEMNNEKEETKNETRDEQ